MKAITYDRFGPPSEVLRFEDIDPPEVGDGDVLVRMRAAAVNPADWHLVRGEPLVARATFGWRAPKRGMLRGGVPGCDVAGVVEAVGADVAGIAVGDEVVGSTFDHGWGAFAELVAVPAELVVPKPDNLPFGEAAAIPLAAMTALQAVRDHSPVEAGSDVLVVGASGGVGSFVVQLAAGLGATVTGVCSGRNADFVRSLGAAHVVDYTTDDFTSADRTYDVVIQVGGSRTAGECRRVLADDGTLLQLSGDSDGRIVGPVPRIVRGALLSPFVGQWIRNFTVEARRNDLVNVIELAASGSLVPSVEQMFPLADTAAAIEHVERGHTRGKVVVTA